MRGLIFDIKRFAIHDGPGIRQTVFLKGCPLSCWWCHNPESRKGGIETCYKPSPGPVKSKEIQIGRYIEVEDLMAELLKDEVFYKHSGGGITFSGGEPLLQDDFLARSLQLCKEKGWHTAVDTSGYVQRAKFDGVLDFTDLFLYDIKLMDSAKHKENVGVPNEKILSNLRYLDEKGKKIRVRFPLVPGINDDDENLEKMLEFLNELKGVEKLHILPYHKLAKSKYEKFNMTETFREVQSPDEEMIAYCKDFFLKAGLNTQIGG